MDGQDAAQDRDRRWDRAKVIATIIDAGTRIAELVLRR